MHINELKRKYVDRKWCHINNRFVKRGGSAGGFAVLFFSLHSVPRLGCGIWEGTTYVSLSGLECANMR